LKPVSDPVKGPFLLASIARFRYRVGCLACERPRPWFGLGAWSGTAGEGLPNRSCSNRD